MNRLLLGACLFLSAFLAFSVQPLLGKLVLPWFGGTSSVWTTALLFFQVLLLLGYLYSHVVVRRLVSLAQGYTHLLLLGASLAVLALSWVLWDRPLLPSDEWRPAAGDRPIPLILATLSAGVGIQFFVLSTTTSLLQSWSARISPGRSPYRLFALSNAGSLLALLSYPFVIETLLTARLQAAIWSAGYASFALLCGYLTWRARRAAPVTDHENSARPRTEPDTAPSVGAVRALLWIALPACTSMLLLATTNQLTQDIAAVPFLWILPLTLYLLSFVLCFASPRWCSRWLVAGLFAATVLHGLLLIGSGDLHIALQLSGYSFVLLTACMVCHGELVRLRPDPSQLTRFYLCIALGGAVGGAFVALLAPLIFDDFHELSLGLALGWVLTFAAWVVDKASPLYGRRTMLVTFATALALASIAVFAMVNFEGSRDMLVTRRNFFGVLWVAAMQSSHAPAGKDALYVMGHGTTVHGSQRIDGRLRRQPTTYYSEHSGVGLALLHAPRDESGLRVGVIGLGTGTLATYGRPADEFRFYEINPDVIELAQGAGGYFSYLSDSPARVEVVSGDARISLEQEAARGDLQRYDVLVLDAFSSHAIPVHLLTRECFETYLEHLAPRGVIAAHIGNPHLDLRPLFARIAAHFGLEPAAVEVRGDGHTVYDSQWMLLAREKAFLELPEIAPHAKPIGDDGERVSLWTDDYSNPFALIR